MIPLLCELHRRPSLTALVTRPEGSSFHIEHFGVVLLFEES